MVGGDFFLHMCTFIRVMGRKKVGLIREGKFPPDSRVALTPAQCQLFKEKFPQIDLVVQPSHGRCFTDAEYAEHGITLQEDLHDCDVLFGIKEVPVESLLHDKTYLFFSHTIKKQPYNRKLMQALLRKRIKMVDYECLVDEAGIRVIAFGRWAGIVGAHNALWTWSKRTGDFPFKRAKDMKDFAALKSYYKKVDMPPLRFVVTGSGRVAGGAMEVMELLEIERVNPEDFLEQSYSKSVYTNLADSYLYRRIKDEGYDKKEFHQFPDRYYSVAYDYVASADVLINGIFWNPEAPRLFEKPDMHRKDFRVQVIADISCDIDGSVPATLRTTTISEPVFGYNKYTDEATAPFESDTIDIMAVDNLPNELPRDASSEFGKVILNTIISELQNPESRMINDATICLGRKLNTPYLYLSEYAAGN